MSSILRRSLIIRAADIHFRRLNVPVCLQTCSALRLSSSTGTDPNINRSSSNFPDKNPKEDVKKQSGPITWKTLALSTVLFGTLLLTLNLGKKEKKQLIEKERRNFVGKAAIGGDFELTDQNNKTVKSTEFLGKWMLLYFGFTHCPDICPAELEKMAAVIKAIEEDPESSAIQPIFISVDPERDSPSAIAKYLAEFSPRFLGMTGTLDQIKDVCKKFRIYFSMGPKESDNDYIVDHSIIMYLMDPEGEFTDYYSQNKTSNEIMKSIKFHMMKYNTKN